MAGFDWNDLQVLLAVQRSKSLRNAAERLNLSAATLSRKLDELEGQIGEKLVERMSTGCELTQVGSRILGYAEQMEELASSIERVRDSHRTEELEGTVRINADEWVSFFLMLHLPKIRQRHPRIAIEVITSHRPYSLTRREADISLRPIQPTHPDLVAKKLGKIEFALYGAENYVAQHQTAIQAQRWSELDFIGFDDLRSSFTADGWLRSLPESGAPWLRCSYALGIYDGVVANGGLGVLATFAVERDGRVIPVTSAIPELTQEIWLTYHRGHGSSGKVRAVAAFISEIFDTAL
ncbi:LysR family transcriptional regulator [Pseudomonas putida]|uniref:LysR family transcriptional regulator n=1 Tax=Pseudomonas putida TaxID=303 RepID=UPI0018D894AC|nr:LysR family transcriptional regulator [Pseudomonas putida]MBH3411593.1 LysR family transcriptional regulator [Pseudomonas putida]